MVKKTEQVAKFRDAVLYKDIDEKGKARFRLVHKGRPVASDDRFKYLNQIMYQIG